MRTTAARGTLWAAVACVLLLAGCSGVRDTLGLTKAPPDEFTIVRKPPLVMPPSFTLRPPRSATDVSEDTDAAKRARAALFGQPTPGAASGANRPTAGAAGRAPGSSTGETAFLTRAGAADADPAIRDVILRETTLLEQKDRSFTDRLIFWRRDRPGDVVDARREAERLRQAAAAGQAPTGGETPTIRRRQRALLEGIF